MEQQTLPVGQLNSTGIPMTGEEYLAMVRSEANQIPHLMVSKTKIDQPDYSNTILTNHRQIFIETENPYKIPTHLYPTQGWLSTQLNQFNILKSKLNSLNAEDCKVQIGKVNDWIAYCKVKENQPTLKLLKTLNQQKTITLLQRMVQLSTMDSIKLFNCWIYAFLLRCDTLLMADDINTLRNLSKKIQQIRFNWIGTTKMMDEQAIGMTLIIAIVGSVFGQADLRDPIRSVDDIDG